ncbi:MAG: hypothetical protein IRD7MM_06910 [Candidatus Midichloria mitochondrii]
MINESFASPANTGKPILLEGGLEWHEMSLSPQRHGFHFSKT